MIGKVIYKLFKPLFLKHYYNEQSKRTGFENLKKVFIDSNGKSYFTTMNDLELPIARSKDLQLRLMRIRSGMSDDNLKLFCEVIKKALNNPSKPDTARIGHTVIEIEKRIGVWIDPDMLFDTVAFMYIREDENPAEVDMSIHNEKIEQFKKDSTGGLKDFFYMAGLTEFIPFLGISESEWSEYFTQSTIKMKALKMQTENYITGSN
jgi:hypothetical protein